MQKDLNTVAKEKADLQSLLSDISHQTKTPIANLKMLNETMLTRPISEEQRREFLQATGSQLDKLDFLIQAMVKTSRLEAGVITLEKKDVLIEETLVSAINGILAPMEKKNICLLYTSGSHFGQLLENLLNYFCGCLISHFIGSLPLCQHRVLIS